MFYNPFLLFQGDRDSVFVRISFSDVVYIIVKSVYAFNTSLMNYYRKYNLEL